MKILLQGLMKLKIDKKKKKTLQGVELPNWQTCSMQRHVWWCINVKNKSRNQKITATERKEEEKRSNREKLKIFNCDASSAYISRHKFRCNWQCECRRSCKPFGWLRINGRERLLAIAIAQDYLDGFMEDSEEELDTNKSIVWKYTDSLTRDEKCCGWSLTLWCSVEGWLGCLHGHTW